MTDRAAIPDTERVGAPVARAGGSAGEEAAGAAGAGAGTGDDDARLAASAEHLAAALLRDAEARRGRGERAQAARMARILADPAGRQLILALTDEVLRIRDPARAAAVLRDLVQTSGVRAGALGGLDRLALQAGARLAPWLPQAVIPAVRERVRGEMSGVILPASPRRLAWHVARRRRQGIRMNVNVLGEAVLGEDEAQARLRRVEAVLSQPGGRLRLGEDLLDLLAARRARLRRRG